MNQHYLSRDGHALHVQVLGRGQPVVLLHGLGANSRQWLPFVWPHLRRFRFFIPDLRAMGRSHAVSYNQADIFQNHMEDLEDLLAHFQLDHIVLGGHSLGNTIALHWQRAGGFDRVKRYLHIDQSPCVKNQPDWDYGVFGHEQTRIFAALSALQALLQAHAEFPLIADLPYAARVETMRIIGRAFSRILGQKALAPVLPVLARHRGLLARHFPVKRVADLDKLLSSYLQAHDYRESLQDCDTPATIIVGQQSPIYDPRGQAAMSHWMKQARVITFSRSGHMPPFQQPVKFTREFSRFLNAAQHAQTDPGANPVRSAQSVA